MYPSSKKEITKLRRSARIRNQNLLKRKKEGGDEIKEEKKEEKGFFRYPKDDIICKSSELLDLKSNEGFIGKGSYGSVRRKEDRVIKTVSLIIGNYEDFMQRNLKEACFLSQYSHQLISNIQCIRKPENNSFDLYLKYSGITLSEVIRKNYTQISITYILYQLLVLLAQMEKLNIVHGDINPGNIVVEITEPFQVTLIDWGFVDVTPQFNINTVGTEGFTAPEIQSVGRHTPLTDMFSLGMVFLFFYTKSYLKNNEIMKYFVARKPLPGLEKVTDPDLKTIISNMIELSSQHRKPASVLLQSPLFDSYRNNSALKKLNSVQFRIREIEQVDPDYVTSIQGVDLETRERLIDRIFEYSEYLSIMPSFSLACYLIDLYLSKQTTINQYRLQLIGMACSYIATVMMMTNEYNTIQKYMKASGNFYHGIELTETILFILRELNFIVFKPRFDHSLGTSDYKIIKALMLDSKGIGQSEDYYLKLYTTIKKDKQNVLKYVTIINDDHLD